MYRNINSKFIGARRATVVLVVAGLAAILLTVFAVIVRLVRNEASQGSYVVGEAQARVMLPSALAFICEYARLGNTHTGEAYGWDDVRFNDEQQVQADHSKTSGWLTIGPRGPRMSGTTPTIPDIEIDTTTYGNLLDSANTWPLPGSVYRADMHVMTRPKFALQNTAVYNPISIPKEWLDEFASAPVKSKTILGGLAMPDPTGADPIFGIERKKIGNMVPWYDQGQRDENDEIIKDPDPDKVKQGVATWRDASTVTVFNEDWTPVSKLATNGQSVVTQSGLDEMWERAWGQILKPLTNAELPFHGNLAPQPVATPLSSPSNNAGFNEEDATPIPSTTDRAWFRVYRETRDSMDGDGTPWYDTQRLAGFSTFIVTCGSGPTRGWRSFDELKKVPSSHPDYKFFQLGGDQAKAESLFKRLRKMERILFYRVQWSASISSGYDAATRYNRTNDNRVYLFGHDIERMWMQDPVAETPTAEANYSLRDFDVPPSLNRSGTISFIQRLDREPPKW